MLSQLLAVMLTATGPTFEVQTVDGRIVVGSIEALNTDQITILTSDGPVSLGTDKLMVLSPKQKPAAVNQDPCAWIDLIDGSSLVARDYLVAEGLARITLFNDQVLELSTTGIFSVRLKPHSEAVAAEWSRMLEMQIDNDLLVVRSDGMLDYHKGVLRDVTGKVVQFDLEGDILPVKRFKVHGLVYHQPPGGELPEAVCCIADVFGSRWSVNLLSLSDELQWTTPSGLTVTQPLASLARIDFSANKVLFLSDLEPQSITWTPHFGSDRDLPLLGRFFALREDTNLQSNPLRLDGQQYDKGLALHSRTKVVYRLPGRFRRFQAIVGIDDDVRPNGDVCLVIYGDDRVLLETTVTGTDPARSIDLELTGVRRLGILVDFGEKLDVADHLDLCNARIIK